MKVPTPPSYLEKKIVVFLQPAPSDDKRQIRKDDVVWLVKFNGTFFRRVRTSCLRKKKHIAQMGINEQQASFYTFYQSF